MIEAVKGDNYDGYIAIDDFLFNYELKPVLCNIYPPEAQVSGTTPGKISLQFLMYLDKSFDNA